MSDHKEAPPKTRGGPQAIRTTISFNPTVHQWAEELRIVIGHTSISDLLGDLVRRKKEELSKKGDPSQYPPHREQITALEERKAEADKRPVEQQVYPRSEKHKKPRNPPGTTN